MRFEKTRRGILLAAGLWCLMTVGYVYIPFAVKNGLYEFELTFLSNVIVGLVFVYGAVAGFTRKKVLPPLLYCNSILLLQMVFFICMAFLNEFRFSGGFLFLHVINPILATVVFFCCTNCTQMPTQKILLSALLFPLAYFVYVVVYGYCSGDWIYSILNVPERGVGFVTVLLIVIALAALLLEWCEYKLLLLLSQRRLHAPQ